MWDLTWLIQRLAWVDLLDIFLVAALFFWLFYALRDTRAVPLVRGIVALLVTLALLSRIVPLRAFSWLVQQLLPAFMVAVPVIFQPELRRALEQLGRGRLLTLGTYREDGQQLGAVIEAVVEASRTMASQHTGALIVFERKTGLQEYVETGIIIDSEVSPELLTTIFNHHTVLHDGAVIVRDERLYAAACVMPLTSAFLSDRHLGLRHRAAIGITEETDAVVIVISEERGTISLTHNGRIIRDLDSDRLKSILNTFLRKRPQKSQGLSQQLLGKISEKIKVLGKT
jgi:diadenylate cyclase